jgi:hypothetical protein
MSLLRWIVFGLCMLAPAISFRLGGTTLWAVHGGACLVAAGLAVWLLHEDGVLRSVFEYKGGDATVAMVAAALVYLPVILALNYWIAPDEITHSLRICCPRGAWLPRSGLKGIEALGEYVRDRACFAYARSAGVRGVQRGASIVLIAAAEEIAWRVGMQRALAERFGRVKGWLYSAVLFGVAHGATGNVTVGLLALLVGFVSGGIYVLRAPALSSDDDDDNGAPTFGSLYLGLGRVVPCVIAHCTFSWFFFYQNAPFVLQYQMFGN